MEVGEQPVHRLELIARIDEEAAPALLGLKPFWRGAVLQDPGAGGAHRHDSLSPGLAPR